MRISGLFGHGLLLLITSSSALLIIFIFYYIIREALPFFKIRGFVEFFTQNAWHPVGNPEEFGALAIFFGSGMVTLGSIIFAVPIGVVAAACLSDILPFSLRQLTKPIIEILAAIPSVAFGFFALVVLAPLMQNHGGLILGGSVWVVGLPLLFLASWIGAEFLATRIDGKNLPTTRWTLRLVLSVGGLLALWYVAGIFGQMRVTSGTNALNVSLVLGIMALPTIVSVSEDALQSVRRELREGAYALGATRAETMMWVVFPAARSGITAAIILGVMRAIGETMVVWMAAGGAEQIPTPWYNFLEPVSTLTATIAGEMGEADHVTGSARYHVLFCMALVLLTISFVFNFISDRIIGKGGLAKGKSA